MTDAKTEITDDKKHYALGIFDSPVIYGVRVETSNPYYLLISKRYLVYGLRLAVKREKVKRVFLLFSHFYDINFCQSCTNVRLSSLMDAMRARDSIRMP